MRHFGLDTKFVMPAWWVKAFEALSISHAKTSDPFDLSQQMGLIPALNRPELNALGALLHETQQQILSGQDTIEIQVKNHVKSSPYIGLHQSFAYDRILQLLGSSHLASFDRESGAHTRLLFDKFEIKFDRPMSEWSVRFSVPAKSQELIFGYLDPYAELLRLCHRQERNFKYCGSNPPLKLWRPLWLELQGIDQSLFLRMECAVQWRKKSLRIDGVYGESVLSLFEDLALHRKNSQDGEESVFHRKWKILKRLGKRLVDHGLLIETNAYEYGSLPQSPDPLFIAWQAAPHYVQDLSNQDFEQAVSRNLCRVEDLQRLVPLIMGSKLFEKNLISMQSVENFFSEKSSSEDQSNDICAVESSFLISSKLVFLEFYLRAQKNHSLSLPEEFKDEAFNYIFIEKSASLDEAYDRFLNYLTDSVSPSRELIKLFDYSLANPKNQSHPQVLEHLVAETKQNLPELNKKAGEEIEVGKSVKEKDGGLHADISQSLPSNLRLKQEARNELDRLRSQDPKRYSDLKDAYLQTLEFEKKKIILEVKQRLQPEVFDDHLKHSLIKFMCENPGYWKSSQIIRN